MNETAEETATSTNETIDVQSAKRRIVRARKKDVSPSAPTPETGGRRDHAGLHHCRRPRREREEFPPTHPAGSLPRRPAPHRGLRATGPVWSCTRAVRAATSLAIFSVSRIRSAERRRIA